MKTAFWGVDHDGKDQLYHWKFLPFGLKNARAEFQRVMDQVLSNLPFARCYIDDVIIFSKTPQYFLCDIFYVLVWFVNGGWYSSCSDIRSLFTRHIVDLVKIY